MLARSRLHHHPALKSLARDPYWPNWDTLLLALLGMFCLQPVEPPPVCSLKSAFHVAIYPILESPIALEASHHWTIDWDSPLGRVSTVRALLSSAGEDNKSDQKSPGPSVLPNAAQVPTLPSPSPNMPLSVSHMGAGELP